MNLPTYNEYEQKVLKVFANSRIAAVIQHDTERSDDKYEVIAFRAACSIQALIEACENGWEIECRFKPIKTRTFVKYDLDNNFIKGYFFIPK